MTKTEPKNQMSAEDALSGTTGRPVRVLFICTHNSARSRIAEGYLRQQYGYLFDAGSAGTEIRPVHPMAVMVMREIGIDISQGRSKRIEEFFSWKPDIVVSVCDSARQACPFFPGKHTRIHAGFLDPAECTGTEEECLAHFRQVRDAIVSWIDSIFVPNCGAGRQNARPVIAAAQDNGESPVPEGPFLSQIHQAANGEVYRIVRSCDLDLIRDK